VTRRILVVDSDFAFATMLKEGLERGSDFEAVAVHTGSDALQSVIEQPFSLVIIDMGVRDIRPGTLVRAIREAKPNMRIMLIPLFGQELPPSAQALNIQGILPKPFFMDELPVIVEAALGVEPGQAVPLAAASSPAIPGSEAELALDLGLEAEPTLDLGLEAEPALDLGLEAEPTLDLGLEAEPTLDLGLEAEPALDLGLEAEPALDLGLEAEPALDLGLEAEPEAPALEMEPPPVAEPEPPPAEPTPPPAEERVLERPAAPPLPSFPYTSALRRKVKDVDKLLDELNREVRAEAILVTSGGELIAFAGVLGRERSEELAAVVAEGAQATARVAGFLGEPDGRFEQSLHQGSEYTMFSLSPAEGLVLSMALSSTTPLGIIRYNALRTGKALLKLAGL
jgi:CheY-like chemotaxis protein